MEAATQTNGGDRFVGRPMKRREDPRFITGTGAYVDDLHILGTVHAAIVRSTEAHAAITSIDTSEAAAQPGILGAFTAEDLSFEGGIPMVWAPPGVDVNTPDHMPLKSGEVKCVGDPVAVVVGGDKYGVVDAAEKVIVEYDPKPAVVDPEAALEEGSPLVWEQFGTNKTHEWAVSGGDIDAALSEADVVLEHRIVNHRTAGAAIEPRGAIAEPRGGGITLH